MEAFLPHCSSWRSPRPCQRQKNSRQLRISRIWSWQVAAISCTLRTSRELQKIRERSDVMVTAPPAVATPSPTADATSETPRVTGLSESPTMAVTAPAALSELPATLAARERLRRRSRRRATSRRRSSWLCSRPRRSSSRPWKRRSASAPCSSRAAGPSMPCGDTVTQLARVSVPHGGSRRRFPYASRELAEVKPNGYCHARGNGSFSSESCVKFSKIRSVIWDKSHKFSGP